MTATSCRGSNVIWRPQQGGIWWEFPPLNCGGDSCRAIHLSCRSHRIPMDVSAERKRRRRVTSLLFTSHWRSALIGSLHPGPDHRTKLVSPAISYPSWSPSSPLPLPSRYIVLCSCLSGLCNHRPRHRRRHTTYLPNRSLAPSWIGMSWRHSMIFHV